MNRLSILQATSVVLRLVSGTTDCCRFVPSCSYYADEAIQKFGWLKGSFLAMKRLLKCAPWSSGGYDPIPSEMKLERKSFEGKLIEKRLSKMRSF